MEHKLKKLQQQLYFKMSICLQAIRGTHSGAEELFRGVSERPNVPLHQNTNVMLGTNTTTMISDSGLTKNAVKLRLEADGNIRVVSVAGSGQVTVNGRLIGSSAGFIKVGDSVALHAPHRVYEYKVAVLARALSTSTSPASSSSLSSVPPSLTAPNSLLSSNGTESANATITANDENADAQLGVAVATGTSTLTTGDTIVPSESDVSSSLKLIAEEFNCAICLELLVHATTMVPCGHSFCRTCVASLTVCSVCSSKVSTRVPCRTLDNAIATLVASHQVFEPDDEHAYQERMEEEQLRASGRSLFGRHHSKSHHAKRRRTASRSRSSSNTTFPSAASVSFGTVRVLGPSVSAAAASGTAANNGGAGASAAQAICID